MAMAQRQNRTNAKKANQPPIKLAPLRLNRSGSKVPAGQGIIPLINYDKRSRRWILRLGGEYTPDKEN